MFSLFGFVETHPQILRNVLSYCDIGSVVNLDHIRMTNKVVCDRFVEKIYKGLCIPAFCKHVFTTPELGVPYPEQMRWVLTRASIWRASL